MIKPYENEQRQNTLVSALSYVNEKRIINLHDNNNDNNNTVERTLSNDT